MKNILVMTGSPRRGGNSDLLADAFIKGALSVGNNAVKFETAFKRIGGCKACLACWSTERACAFEDGFTELEPLLEAADMVVFATPLYWFSMSAQLKSAIDRFYAYMRENRKRSLRASECILLVCGNNEGPEIFDGVVASYKAMANYLNWTDRGIIAVGGVDAVGDIKNTDALIRAEALGRSF